MSKLNEYLIYYKQKLERNMNDENMVETIIQKLNRVNVSIDISALLNTGVYKLVRGISKSGSGLSELALPLYNKWKTLILESQNDGRKVSSTQNNIPLANPPNELPGNRINDAANPFKLAKIQKDHSEIQKNILQVTDNGACGGPEFDTPIINEFTPLIDLKPILNDFKPLLNNFKPLPNESKPSSSSFKALSDKYKPSSNDFKPFSNNFKATFNDFKPVSTDFKPTLSDFKPLTNDFKPTLSDFKPLPSDFKPTLSDFKPLPNDFKPTLSDFKPLPNDFKPTLSDFKPLTNDFKPTLSDFKPLPNDFKPTLSDFKPLIPPTIKIENNDFKKDAGSSNDSSAQLIYSNSFASPSSNSQNSSELLSITNTSSPNKVKIPEPYAIEMREGMFRVVKSNEDLPPDILRIRRLYNNDLDESPSKENNITKTKSPKKSESSSKNGRAHSEKSSEKKSLKSKTPEKAKKDLKPTFDKIFVKSKSSSPSNKSAIEKSKSKETDKKIKGKPKFSTPERNVSPLTVSSNDAMDIDKKVKEKSKFPTPERNVSPLALANKEAKDNDKKVKDKSKYRTAERNVSPLAIANRETVETDKKVKEKSRLSNIEKNVSPLMIASKETISALAASPAVPCDIKETGHKSCDKKIVNKDVSSLKHSCIRLLRKNIDIIKSTKVPYKVLKPVLQCCSATQLRRIEEYNKYFLEDTDDLWKSFCKKKYHQTPESHESWRDLYWRLRTDQDRKLKNLTASISASLSRSAPERQAKVKLIDSPENHKSKRIKLSSSESSDAMTKLPAKQSTPKLQKEATSSSHSTPSSSGHKNPSKDQSARTPSKELKTPSKEPSAKTPLKDSPSFGHKSHKESTSAHKKTTKKTNCAPLMSKVKKTVGLLAMHKK